ncbi:hypothetical protein V2G26_011208 [Clonostachys chloroleuca]
MVLSVRKALRAIPLSPVPAAATQQQRHYLIPRSYKDATVRSSPQLKSGIPTSDSRRRGDVSLGQARGFATNQPKDPKNLPLDGITVVSLEQAIAGPFCTRQLADLGARVIKVERPGDGDFARKYDNRVAGMASHFIWTNRSKESLALDLKKPKSLEVLKRLLAKADVLVQNLVPGATERLGLSFDKLRKKNPGLVVCNISGYGPDGPYSDKKAYDLLVQSEAGLLSVTGSESEPAKVGISIADIASAMYAHQNILAALLRRGKTGEGASIDVSMLESMAEWMSFPMYYSYGGADGPSRTGASHATVYPYGPFPTGSGDCIILGVQNEREWKLFCEHVIGDAELSYDRRFTSNSLRVENRDALRDIICSIFLKYRVEEVLALLDKARIANARMNKAEELWDHPQLKARGRWTEVETPIGPVPALLPPGVASEEEVKMEAVPAVGDHNASILAELGLTEADLLED